MRWEREGVCVGSGEVVVVVGVVVVGGGVCVCACSFTFSKINVGSAFEISEAKYSSGWSFR